MKTLNKLINEYTFLLQQGEIQTAYKGIMEFIGKLRAEFIKRFHHFDIGGFYQGYMDMTYFSLSSKLLKDKGLKIAVVYLHEKGTFEVWLSPRNREVAKSYEFILGSLSESLAVFHDDGNPDAIVEYILTSAPDFNNQSMLIDFIEQGVKRFIEDVSLKL